MPGTIVCVDAPRAATPAEDRRWWRRGGGWRRLWGWWPWLRYLVGLALAGVALWAVLGQRGELSGFSAAISHLRWWWVALGLLAEAGSYVAFAVAQRRLLAVTGVTVPAWSMTVIIFVATAITNSVPGGPVVASIFSFRQFRRRGADEVTAGWALLAIVVAAGTGLALLAGVGLVVAGAEGVSTDLVEVTAAVVAVALAGSVLLVQRRAAMWLVERSLHVVRRAGGRSAEAFPALSVVGARLAAVRISWRQMAGAVLWSGGNWVLDCGCLCLAFLALGAPVPWRGLLLAYGAGQLAANLPITPGGLGVVEGSMTIALVAFGGDVTTTATAVLLYRLMSYWLELPIGWAAWAVLAWHQRHLVAGDADGADVLSPGAGWAPVVTPAHVAQGDWP